MASDWVTVAIRRASRVSDGAGGKVETYSDVATGLKAHRRLYSQQSWWRTEASPGVRTENQCLFILFGTTYPDVRVNDVLKEEGGAEWRVLFVRAYSHSLQIDTRRVT